MRLRYFVLRLKRGSPPDAGRFTAEDAERAEKRREMLPAFSAASAFSAVKFVAVTFLTQE